MGIFDDTPPATYRGKPISILDAMEKFYANDGLAGLLGMQSAGSQMMQANDNARAIAESGGSVYDQIKAQENNPMLMALGTSNISPGIKAYHGSPHDFDKFDASKIGTGEGAQAYGHGLYFAENPQTAQAYRASTAKFGFPDGAPENGIATLIAAKGAEGETMARKAYQSLGADKLEAAISAAKEAVSKNSKMYEVNIKANPDHFLDWDKPLSSEQSAKMIEALGDVRPVKLGNGYYGMTRVGPDGSGRIIEGINRSTPEEAAAEFKSLFSGRRGRDADSLISGILGDRAAASESLSKAGIPGIKYLDQGSRAGGEGSRNYVVFDPATIEILKKYGLLGMIGGGAAATQEKTGLFD